MTLSRKEHQRQADEIFEKINEEEYCSELDWQFEWSGQEGPKILDANGEVVCVFSTGTLEGSYSNEQIIANIKKVLKGNQIVKDILNIIEVEENSCQFYLDKIKLQQNKTEKPSIAAKQISYFYEKYQTSQEALKLLYNILENK